MTITIELKDEQARELQQIATNRGVTVDELARTLLLQELQPSQRSVAPDVRQAMLDSFQANDEVYRRLAQ
jgi:predicted transcriptional regulator